MLWTAPRPEVRVPGARGKRSNRADQRAGLTDPQDPLPAAGYVLFLRSASDLWLRDPQSAGCLVESWLMAAEEWGQRGIPFHLVFVW